MNIDTKIYGDCLMAAIDDRVGWRKRAMGVDWDGPSGSSSRSSSSLWMHENLKKKQKGEEEEEENEEKKKTEKRQEERRKRQKKSTKKTGVEENKRKEEELEEEEEEEEEEKKKKKKTFWQWDNFDPLSGWSARSDWCTDHTHPGHKGRECDLHHGHSFSCGRPRRFCEGHLWAHVRLDCGQDQQSHLQTSQAWGCAPFHWCTGHLRLWELWQEQVGFFFLLSVFPPQCVCVFLVWTCVYMYSWIRCWVDLYVFFSGVLIYCYASGFYCVMLQAFVCYCSYVKCLWCMRVCVCVCVCVYVCVCVSACVFVVYFHCSVQLSMFNMEKR